MKSIYVFGLALILAGSGCYTSRQVATMQGQGTRQTFNASFDQVWRAAVDAAQQPGLSVVTTDRDRGYIATRRTIRPYTFGENVGLWVTSISPNETTVEVVSRQAGPPVAWLKNWENEIIRSLAANLSREAPVGIGSTATESYSTSGSTRSTVPSNFDSGASTLTTSEAITLEQRRLNQLRKEQELRRQELLREQDQGRRDKLDSEIERLRAELRTIENKLLDLEEQQKQLK